MRSPFSLALAFALPLALAAPAAADEDADAMAVERGKALAERLCAECHVVNGTRGSDAVPTLHSLANTPGMTQDRIRAFIYDPHPQMPAIQIPTDEMDDLVAYIASLKGAE
jgi:mono/diheme cytochrome c family protein